MRRPCRSPAPLGRPSACQRCLRRSRVHPRLHAPTPPGCGSSRSSPQADAMGSAAPCQWSAAAVPPCPRRRRRAGRRVGPRLAQPAWRARQGSVAGGEAWCAHHEPGSREREALRHAVGRAPRCREGGGPPGERGCERHVPRACPAPPRGPDRAPNACRPALLVPHRRCRSRGPTARALWAQQRPLCSCRRRGRGRSSPWVVLATATRAAPALHPRQSQTRCALGLCPACQGPAESSQLLGRARAQRAPCPRSRRAGFQQGKHPEEPPNEAAASRS
mmetsp:Transcript_4249/g.13711  ORF Transcript_4249/g.13711 Transcript_4249/m.13711 type:complete len:276 (+) Transcript_4249:575-1402(+)